MIKTVVYEVDGKKVYGNLPKKQYTENTIIGLWEAVGNPDIAVYRNTRTLYYFRINKNPREQLNKYGKIYGRCSTSRTNFENDSAEIYGYYKPEWVIIWHKKNVK